MAWTNRFYRFRLFYLLHFVNMIFVSIVKIVIKIFVQLFVVVSKHFVSLEDTQNRRYFLIINWSLLSFSHLLTFYFLSLIDLWCIWFYHCNTFEQMKRKYILFELSEWICCLFMIVGKWAMGSGITRKWTSINIIA